MQNLTAGMLCLVLPGPQSSSFAGSCVRLLRFIPSSTPINDRPTYNGGRPFQFLYPVWEVESEDVEGHIQPKYLMPISGDSSPDLMVYTKEISNA